ncbi:MAG TPA: peptidoglycan bridge formation glycyltransferase FemA/FemB family protein [Candidatus Faecimonas intestinavium]|nr:peptidoglycan bridge formation glycyltransferase FemA/FemB family protein [Candidatus Faecimonas intestinavium]
MKLKKISEKEFKKFADKNLEITFYQTISWAHLKKKNGWVAHYLGLEKDNKIIAGSLILAKTLPIIKKKMFYAPRGFLLDYKNKEVLKEFTKQLKEYAKEEHAIFIKIDPYVEYKEHDNNGNIVEEGLDNSICVENLKSLGYKHFGFNLMQDTLQPRWMHVIETEDKTLADVMKDMESKTRQILRKNERSGIHTREISKEELPLFKDIMQHTSDRREFVDRPLSYYESMWDSLHDDGILKILVAEIDFLEFEKNTKEELETNEKELKERIYKHENNILKMNPKKYEQNNKKNEQEIERLKKQLEKIKDYKEKYGNKKLLGGILFLIYGNEVLSLHGGTLDDVMQFQSAYTIHFAGVKHAVENGYKRYNFYGITGDFRKENPLYGLYLFKKSFGGHVVELIGEFDYIISPFWYHTYNIAFAAYHKLKNLKKKK